MMDMNAENEKSSIRSTILGGSGTVCTFVSCQINDNTIHWLAASLTILYVLLLLGSIWSIARYIIRRQKGVTENEMEK